MWEGARQGRQALPKRPVLAMGRFKELRRSKAGEIRAEDLAVACFPSSGGGLCEGSRLRSLRFEKSFQVPVLHLGVIRCRNRSMASVSSQATSITACVEG